MFLEMKNNDVSDILKPFSKLFAIDLWKIFSVKWSQIHWWSSHFPVAIKNSFWWLLMRGKKSTKILLNFRKRHHFWSQILNKSLLTHLTPHIGRFLKIERKIKRFPTFQKLRKIFSNRVLECFLKNQSQIHWWTSHFRLAIQKSCSFPWWLVPEKNQPNKLSNIRKGINSGVKSWLFHHYRISLVLL